MISLNQKCKARTHITPIVDWNKSANDFILSKNVTKGDGVTITVKPYPIDPQQVKK